MAQNWGDRGYDNGRYEIERGERGGGDRRFDWERGRGEGRGEGRDEGRDFGRDWDRMMGSRMGGDVGREYRRDYGNDYGRGGQGYEFRPGEGTSWRGSGETRETRGMGGMGGMGGRFGQGGFGEENWGRGEWGGGREMRGLGAMDPTWRREQGYNLGRGSQIDESWRGRSQGDEQGGGMMDRLRDMGRRVLGRGPKGFKRSDERIYEEVCERIARFDVNADNVEVKVKDGEVTLMGSVEDRQDKRLIEDVAEDVFGVQQVHNQIRLQRSTATTMGTTTGGRTDKMHS